MILIRDRKSTPKNLCDKDFAKFSGGLSGAIFMESKPIVLVGITLELFKNIVGAVGAIFWLWGSFLALYLICLYLFLVALEQTKMAMMPEILRETWGNRIPKRNTKFIAEIIRNKCRSLDPMGGIQEGKMIQCRVRRRKYVPKNCL